MPKIIKQAKGIVSRRKPKKVSCTMTKVVCPSVEKGSGRKRFTFILPTELSKTIVSAARQNNESMHTLVERAIRTELGLSPAQPAASVGPPIFGKDDFNVWLTNCDWKFVLKTEEEKNKEQHD